MVAHKKVSSTRKLKNQNPYLDVKNKKDKIPKLAA